MKHITDTFKRWLKESGYNGEPKTYLRYQHIIDEYIMDIEEGYPYKDKDGCIND